MLKTPITVVEEFLGFDWLLFDADGEYVGQFRKKENADLCAKLLNSADSNNDGVVNDC